ncbi:MAG: DUF899 family protein [Candidatus Cloacimonadaceae bacterium]|nr:DUF899 family protein [Candidatus Cloacimonadaceae bacterium]
MNEKERFDRISALEQEIMRTKTELYQLKRQVPRFEIPDYKLLKRDGSETTLSALFGAKNEMILVHNMGASCPYCTLWADGFTGIKQHLEDRAAFVVSTPDPPEKMNAFATSRGWNFETVSTSACTLKADLGFQLADGSYYPGVSTLFKDESGKIFHVAKAFFGPGDDFCALWYLFDLLPVENPDWSPKFKY